MLRNRRRSLSLVDRNRGKLDLIVVLTTAALIFIGLIAIANATMDPYAVGEGEGLFGVLSRLTSDSFYWQLLWVGIGLAAIVLIMLFDYRIYGELSPYIFGAAILLMVLAVIYLASGGQSQMNFDGNFFPDFSNFDNLVLASSIFLFYAGMEMGGIHVKDMENPAKNYPKAVFIGAAITVIIFVLGTFALGIIIPEKDINLTQSLLVGFDNYFKYVHASWLSPIIAVALAFGVLAGVLTWVAGPSKGIFAVGKAGYLPPFFQKTNANGVQKNILLIQGLAVTLLSLLFVVMPSVQSFYQILSQLTVLLYLIMYLLMFSGAIYLRYNMKKTPRPFRIGSKGNGLMWLIGGLGFCGSLLAFVLSFIPPSQIAVGSNTVWFAVLIIGCVVVVAAPFIIYASRKPSWVDKNTQFEPFHWEVQATTAQTAAPVSGAAKSSASSASTNAAAGPASQSTPTPEQHK